MKTILLKYLEETKQSYYRFERRISVNTSKPNISLILTYNKMFTIPVFKKMYKCICEDGYIEYADKLKEIYKNKLREKHKELLDFMEEE